MGGGIEADGGSWASIKRCKFWENTADKGAAIVMSSKSNLVVTDSQFIKNKAHISGAIEASDKSTIDVSKCTFKSQSKSRPPIQVLWCLVGNFASFGGALYVFESSEGSVKECSFVNNTGVQNGGAIEVFQKSFAEISDSFFKGTTQTTPPLLISL